MTTWRAIARLLAAGGYLEIVDGTLRIRGCYDPVILAELRACHRDAVAAWVPCVGARPRADRWDLGHPDYEVPIPPDPDGADTYLDDDPLR